MKIRKIPTHIKNDSLVKKRRQQILDAVMQLFPRKGYHMTTLREISKETGITLGNLYDYISTKEDVLYIVQERATQAILETMAKRNGESLDPVDKLRELVSLELDVVNKYQDLIMILYQESHAFGKALLKSSLRSERTHIREYEAVIEEGIEKGVFKPTNVRMLSNIIKMLVDTWVIKRWDLREKVSLEEMREGILDIIFNGIAKRNQGSIDLLRAKKGKSLGIKPKRIMGLGNLNLVDRKVNKITPIVRQKK